MKFIEFSLCYSYHYKQSIFISILYKLCPLNNFVESRSFKLLYKKKKKTFTKVRFEKIMKMLYIRILIRSGIKYYNYINRVYSIIINNTIFIWYFL